MLLTASGAFAVFASSYAAMLRTPISSGLVLISVEDGECDEKKVFICRIISAVVFGRMFDSAICARPPDPPLCRGYAGGNSFVLFYPDSVSGGNQAAAFVGISLCCGGGNQSVFSTGGAFGGGTYKGGKNHSGLHFRLERYWLLRRRMSVAGMGGENI